MSRGDGEETHFRPRLQTGWLAKKHLDLESLRNLQKQLARATLFTFIKKKTNPRQVVELWPCSKTSFGSEFPLGSLSWPLEETAGFSGWFSGILLHENLCPFLLLIPLGGSSTSAGVRPVKAAQAAGHRVSHGPHRRAKRDPHAEGTKLGQRPGPREHQYTDTGCSRSLKVFRLGLVALLCAGQAKIARQGYRTGQVLLGNSLSSFPPQLP